MSKIKNALLALILLFCSSMELIAKESADSKFTKANTLFQKQDFEGAVKGYFEVLRYDSTSPEVWFNLGNAYYRLGDFPKAILSYERAKKISPADEDIEFNLHVANLHTTDKIDPLPRIFYLRWIDVASYLFSLSDWAVTIVILFVLIIIFILCYFLIPSIAIRKTSFYFGVVSFLLVVSSYNLALHQRHLIYGTERAIIISASVYVKSSPDEKGTDLFILHEGTKVDLLDELNDWKKIRIANGSIGWVRENTFEVI
ncbi:MAG TPA: tetratricopeptide repeat protein [Bacteroidia bacterium]|nr:tetratricopeptide repeat protein [Bacteroidia bacterium]